MRKALTMDVEKKSVVPLPAPVSMLSLMMLTWMLLLMLAILSQYAIVSIVLKKLALLLMPTCMTFNFHVRFTWTRWTTKEEGGWTARPAPPFQLRAKIYS